MNDNMFFHSKRNHKGILHSLPEFLMDESPSYLHVEWCIWCGTWWPVAVEHNIKETWKKLL